MEHERPSNHLIGMERRGISTHVSVWITIAAMVAIASLATAEQLPTQDIAGISTGRPGRPWPCCNNCGICTKSLPPLCKCEDVVLACHPSCENCVQSPIKIYPPRYQCVDFITNYCDKKCDPEYAEAGEDGSAV